MLQVFNPKNNFGGIIGLATEIVAKKISSEEEKYSDYSWMIFYNNYKGIYSQVCLSASACNLWPLNFRFYLLFIVNISYVWFKISVSMLNLVVFMTYIA